MVLGSGQNNLNVDTLIVGGLNSNGRVAMNSGGKLTLRDRAGTGGANVYIGDNDDVTNTTQNEGANELALVTGEVDLKINSLVIGRYGANSSNTNTGGGRGVFSFGGSSLAGMNSKVEASTVQLGVVGTRGVVYNPGLTSGLITMDGGTFSFGTMSKGGGLATFNWNGGTIRNIPGRDAFNENVVITPNQENNLQFFVEGGRTMTFGSTATLKGTVGVHKTGPGTMVLQGDSSGSNANVIFGGGFFVDEGRLVVTNTVGSAIGTGGVLVGQYGELHGTGSVGSSDNLTIAQVSAGGKISPGLPDSTTLGQLSFGNLTLEANAILKLDLRSGGAPGIDKLLVDGTFDFTGATDEATAITLELTDVQPGLLLNTPLPFITYTSIDPGLFKVNGKLMLDYIAGVSKIEDAFWIGQNGFWIDYNFNGNSQIALIAVPEPGALASLLGGMGMLVGLQRFRRWGSAKR